MELHLLNRTTFSFSISKFFSSLILLLFILITTTSSSFGQTLIGPSELLANTESSYYISDPSVTGDWEVNGSATVSTNLVNQNAIKVKANNFCYGRFTVIVKIGDKYLFRQVDIIKNLPPIFTSGATTATLSCNSTLEDFNKYKPTAKDIDGNAVEVVMKDMVPMQMGRCLSIVTWEATDRCGNKATFNQSIEIVGNTVDTEAPIFDTTTLVKTYYNCDKIPSTFPVPRATDNCVNPVMVKLVRREISERIRSSTACMSYFEILTWEATDVCGNRRQADQTICIVDTVPPVFVSSTLAPITVNQCGFNYDLYQPKANDNCSNPVMIMAVNFRTTVIDQCRRTVVITWEATDMCGNATRANQTFNIIDQTPPRINRGLPLPALTYECDDIPLNFPVPTAVDDCEGFVDIDLDGREVIVAGNCVGVIELTWKATDVCGNMSFAKQRVNIFDRTAPTITCAAPITVSCASNVPVPNIAGIVAADNCDLAVAVTFVSDVISNQTCANRYTITRTYRGTDDCGNATNCTQIITVNDRTAPVIACPGTITVSCSSLVPAPNTTLPTATDNCGGAVVVSHVGDAAVGGQCINRFTITRTYMATDACGNTAICTQSIIVNDITAPVITATGTNLALGCNPAIGQIDAALGIGTATDNCGGAVMVTPTDGQVVINGCQRSLTRTFNAFDACGNVAIAVIRTATWTLDNVAPVITATGTVLALGCNPSAVAINAALGTATATDACGNVIPVATDGLIIVNGCGRSQTRTFNATDACSNVATPVTRTATWTLDVTAPTFTFCPPGSNLGCNPTSIPAPGAATATDDCGAPTITSALSAITSNGCRSIQTRTYTATDACGNTATCGQVFSWSSDAVGPTFTFCPPGANLGCNPVGVPAAGVAVATDPCGAVTITNALGTLLNNGCNRTQQRIYTATDACGNASTCSQTFTWVEDLVPPVLVGLPTSLNITVGCNSIPTAPVVTATDACGTATVTFNETRNVGTCLTTITRTWFATDACRNVSATVTQIINVTEAYTVNLTQQDIDRLISPASVCCEEDAIAQFRALNIQVIATVCGVAIPVSATICADMNGCSTGSKGSTYRVFFTWRFSTPCNPNTVITLFTSKFININPNPSNCQICGTQRVCDPNGGVICDVIIPLKAPNLGNRIVDVVKDKANDISLSEGYKFNNYSDGIKVRDFKVSASPNPTTGDINFNITTPTKGDLRLKLFDASGKQIGLIVRQGLEGGFENQINYNIPATVSSGLIFYTITVGEEVKSGKLMYMKN